VFGDPAAFLLRVLFLVPALLLGFVLHEFAHAGVALSQGDPTPRNQGRLSLDPRRHIDPLGALLVVFVGIGYARPVQVNPSRLRTEFSRLLVAIAGPAANLAVAIVASVALKLIAGSQAILGHPDFTAFCSVSISPFEIVKTALVYVYTLNLFLMLFNLLPIPPLDGFELIRTVLRRNNPRLVFQMEMNSQQIFFGFILIFLLLPVFVPTFAFLGFFNIMSVILQPLVLLLGVPLQFPCG
jgi:Zn-dependent protease